MPVVAAEMRVLVQAQQRSFAAAPGDACIDQRPVDLHSRGSVQPEQGLLEHSDDPAGGGYEKPRMDWRR